MKNKIQNLLLVSTLLAGSSLFAGEDFAKERYKKGYSYFSIISTKMKYTSNVTTSAGTYDTDATSTNPVYIAGNLFVINDTYDVSSEVSTTLLPQRADETWTLDGSQVQANNADMMSNNIQVLGHYKFTDEHRVIFGGTYSLSSYKRYNFTTGNIDTKRTIIEQRSKSLSFETGYWYEGYFMDKSALHVNVKAIVGLPIYENTENTDTDETYSNNGGYNVNLYASVGYRVLAKSEVGALVGYSIVDRNGEGKLPQNTVENFYMGLYLSF